MSYNPPYAQVPQGSSNQYNQSNRYGNTPNYASAPITGSVPSYASTHNMSHQQNPPDYWSAQQQNYTQNWTQPNAQLPSYASSSAQSYTSQAFSPAGSGMPSYSQPQYHQQQPLYPTQTQQTNSFTPEWYNQYYQSLGKNELDLLEKWFKSVDTDNSGEIDQRELSNMRMPGIGPFTGRLLGIDAAARLITLFDSDNTGTINFKEYAALHCFMDKMNTSFHKADGDGNGVLDKTEISHAIAQAGFNVSDVVIDMFFKKYDSGQGLDFVQFMQMVSDIALIKSKFHWLDRDGDGLLNLDDVLRLCADLNPKPTQIVFAANSAPVKQKQEGCCIS
mmetsp:Transcript_18890/g.32136  ORF Transcript_18890/g.32136 Transcript_18890/m.32136 type:complete len:333 (+) Transcript_18890:8-1006(+)